MITGASNISRDLNRTWPFMFNCVDEEWQHNACAIMGLEFVAGNCDNSKTAARCFLYVLN